MRKLLRYFVLSALALAIDMPTHAADQTRIRFAVTDAPPLATAASHTSSGMTGLFPAILDELLSKRLALQWEGVFLPWKRAQLAVQSGDADLIITVPSIERKAYALPSVLPVFEEYLHVYTYVGHPRIKEIRSIETAEDIRRLGLVPATNIGNNWHSENIDAFGIKTRHVPADSILPRFLAARRADIMIDAPATMDPKIEELGLTKQIEKTQVKFGPIGFHILIGKASPLAARMKALDQAIDQFVQDGTRERLAARYLRSSP